MNDEKKPEDIIRQILENLPRGFVQTKQDLEKNLKSVVQAALTRMDLVTREEFQIQSELLVRTRNLLEKLEKKVARLEKSKEKPE